MRPHARAWPLALGILWALLLLPGQSLRVSQLMEAMPRASFSHAERAEHESENAPFHRFLRGVALIAPARSTLLLLVDDYLNQHTYFYYRACYELYPTRFLVIPIRNFNTPNALSFQLSTGERTLAAIEREKVELAGLYVRRPGAVPSSRLFSVKPAPGNFVTFERLADPVSAAGPSRVPPPSRPFMWWLGLASAIGLGWILNAASGLARGFGRDRAALAAMALFTGTGFLALVLFLLSLAGVPWSPTVLAGTLLLPAAAGILMIRRRCGPAAPDAGAGDPLFSGSWHDWLGLGLIAFAAVTSLFHAWLPQGAWGNWDAWAIYDLKTKILWEARGVPLAFLTDDLYKFTNQAYALGFQIFQAYLGFWAGGVGSPLVRLISPVFHIAQALVVAHLLADLGAGRLRWVLAGLLSVVPALLLYAANGYMDLMVAAVMTGALALLVKAVRGSAPVWGVGWMCGVASLTKDEGLTFSVFSVAVLAGVAFFRRISWKSFAVCVLVLGLTAGPWRALTSHLGVGHKDWNTSPAYIMSGMPDNGVMVAKSFLLEMFGNGPSMRNMKGEWRFSVKGWLLHLRGSWVLLWFAVLGGLIAGRRRLKDPAILAVLAVLVLQFAAHCLLYLTTIHDLAFHLVTSVNRRLIQFAPPLFAIAAAAWLGRDREEGEGGA